MARVPPIGELRAEAAGLRGLDGLDELPELQEAASTATTPSATAFLIGPRTISPPNPPGLCKT
jgi:hypothetical protein